MKTVDMHKTVTQILFTFGPKYDHHNLCACQDSIVFK